MYVLANFSFTEGKHSAIICFLYSQNNSKQANVNDALWGLLKTEFFICLLYLWDYWKLCFFAFFSISFLNIRCFLYLKE